MNPAVEQIARAVLYEGYLLYPYRRSSLKNQQRWNFGVLYPPAWAAQQKGSDRACLQMECIAICGDSSSIGVSLRFLHLTSIESVGRKWQEAEERQVFSCEIEIAELTKSLRLWQFDFTAAEKVDDGVRRRRMPLQAHMEMTAVHVQGRAYRLAVRVTNVTQGVIETRDDALLLSLASAHIVLSIRDGEFVSQIDPPEELREEVAACQNTGVWPVLVGDAGASDVMLGSPIILYDYPQVAPESQGDLFDGTEIDEILTLRILTLTDDEKDELRRSDERARRLLERLEAAPQEHLLNLHGAIRGMRETRDLSPAAAVLNGKRLKKGDRVVLRPKKRADVFDTLLAGKVAIVEAVEEDFESQTHVAVVLEDDPGRDLGEMRQAGHRFFYGLDEIAPILDADGTHPARSDS